MTITAATLIAEAGQDAATLARIEGDLCVQWHDVMSATWHAEDHINEGELRATLLWAELLAREPHRRHTRIVDLSDSGVAVGALTKGRSSRFRINRLLRRRAVLEIAGGFVLLPRWVSTRIMLADRLSRDRRVCGVINDLYRKRKHATRFAQRKQKWIFRSINL